MEPRAVAKVSRRVVLSGTAAGAALVIAGCSQGSDPATTSSAPSTPAAGGGSSSPATGGSSTQATTPQGDPVVATDQIKVGSGVILASDAMVVTQPTQGTFVAVSNVCTHQGCPVSTIEDGNILCPCHNSKFDLRGAVVQGPATEPLPAVAITVANGQVYKA